MEEASEAGLKKKPMLPEIEGRSRPCAENCLARPISCACMSELPRNPNSHTYAQTDDEHNRRCAVEHTRDFHSATPEFQKHHRLHLLNTVCRIPKSDKPMNLHAI